MTNVAKMFYAVEDISKEYTFSLDSDVLRYLETLNGLTVPEAQEKLSKFFNETKHGSCLYAVNEFVKMFPKSSFAYTPVVFIGFDFSLILIVPSYLNVKILSLPSISIL